MTLNAADVVASIRSLGGGSVCGNDDCNRDGGLNGDDADCAAGCLFGRCPVPPNAPRAHEILPLTAPSILPGSLITVRALNPGPQDAVKRVTIGGLEATVVDFSDDTLTVAVPLVGAGSHGLVVFDGDVAGPAVAIEVAPAEPNGAPDGLGDVLQLADDFVAVFLALELEQLYDEDTLPILLQALADFRSTLTAVDLESEPNLTPEAVSEINAIIDASGAADFVRREIAQLGLGGGLVSGQAAGVTRAVQGLTMIAWQVRGGVTIAAAAPETGAASFSLGGVAAASAGVALIAGLAFGVVELPPVAVGDPEFFDADGNPRTLPVAGGLVRMRTNNFIDAGIDLVAKTAYGEFRRSGSDCGSSCREYRLPQNIGFCGHATFSLARGLARSDAPYRTNIRPSLIDLFPNRAQLGDRLDVVASGVEPCLVRMVYFGPESSPGTFVSDRFEANPLATFAGAPLPSLPNTALLELPSGDYAVRLEVEESRSFETAPLEFVSQITGLSIDCDPTVIVADRFFSSTPEFDPEALSGLFSLCEARPQPAGTLFPHASNLEWQSTTTAVTLIDASGIAAEAHIAGALGSRQGTAEVFATLTVAGIQLADSNRVALEVKDTLAPRVETNFTPACGSTDRPQLVMADATDNLLMSLIRLKIDQGDRRVFEDLRLCPPASDPQETCNASFSVPLGVTFEPGAVTVEVEAIDDAGQTTRRQCAYTIPGTPTAVHTPTRSPTGTPTGTPTITPAPTTAHSATPGVGPEFESGLYRLSIDFMTRSANGNIGRLVSGEIRSENLVLAVSDATMFSFEFAGDDTRSALSATVSASGDLLETFTLERTRSDAGRTVDFLRLQGSNMPRTNVSANGRLHTYRLLEEEICAQVESFERMLFDEEGEVILTAIGMFCDESGANITFSLVRR